MIEEIIACLEMHADYDIEGGFTEKEFVTFVMDGIGSDMVREGHDWETIEDAARAAYPRMSSRFHATESVHQMHASPIAETE